MYLCNLVEHPWDFRRNEPHLVAIWLPGAAEQILSESFVLPDRGTPVKPDFPVYNYEASGQDVSQGPGAGRGLVPGTRPQSQAVKGLPASEQPTDVRRESLRMGPQVALETSAQYRTTNETAPDQPAPAPAQNIEGQQPRVQPARHDTQRVSGSGRTVSEAVRSPHTPQSQSAAGQAYDAPRTQQAFSRPPASPASGYAPPGLSHSPAVSQRSPTAVLPVRHRDRAQQVATTQPAQHPAQAQSPPGSTALLPPRGPSPQHPAGHAPSPRGAGQPEMSQVGHTKVTMPTPKQYAPVPSSEPTAAAPTARPRGPRQQDTYQITRYPGVRQSPTDARPPGSPQADTRSPTSDPAHVRLPTSAPAHLDRYVSEGSTSVTRQPTLDSLRGRQYTTSRVGQGFSNKTSEPLTLDTPLRRPQSTVRNDGQTTPPSPAVTKAEMLADTEPGVGIETTYQQDLPAESYYEMGGTVAHPDPVTQLGVATTAESSKVPVPAGSSQHTRPGASQPSPQEFNDDISDQQITSARERFGRPVYEQTAVKSVDSRMLFAMQMPTQDVAPRPSRGPAFSDLPPSDPVDPQAATSFPSQMDVPGPAPVAQSDRMNLDEESSSEGSVNEMSELSPTTKAGSTKCIGTTQKGKRCKRTVKNRGEGCHNHRQNGNAPKCGADSGACPNLTSYVSKKTGLSLCHEHISWTG